MEQDLTTQLVNNEALAEVVADRITWGARDAGDPLPAVVLHKISGRPGYTMAGPDGLTPYRIQADCLAATFLEAARTANAVRAAFAGLTDPFSAPAFIQDERTDFAHDPTPDAGGATDLHRSSLDFQVWHSEP